MASGELITVAEDGTQTAKPLEWPIPRELLASWKAQNDAWEDYCARKAKADNYG